MGTGFAARRRHFPARVTLRIAYVTETFPPEINGVSLTAARAVGHLRSSGHVVQLVRPRQAEEKPLDTELEWRTAGGPIPMYRELRWGHAGVAAMRRRWQRFAPQLVHVATPGPLGWAALRAARVEGVPTSADFRTDFQAYSAHYRLRWLAPLVQGYLKRLHAMADCTFVPTPELAQRLTGLGYIGVQISGRGVDAKRFSPIWRDAWLRQAWRADDATVVLLIVSRLAPEKNIGLALAAARQLRRERQNLQMVVVGDGPLRRKLEAAHPDVRFAGIQRGTELARHYASADVFIFPSLTETFGNVTLEAMASGLALVAYNAAAAAVHVQDGVNGCLASPGDEAEFIAAARRALAASAPDGALRRAARETALKADWPSELEAFEQRLCAVAKRALPDVGDAALA